MRQKDVLSKKEIERKLVEYEWSMKIEKIKSEQDRKKMLERRKFLQSYRDDNKQVNIINNKYLSIIFFC
jgi:hypothetical protein